MNTFLLIFLVILLLEALVSTIMKFWYVNLDRVGQPWYVPGIDKEANITVSAVINVFWI